jgi:hypothetical protein
VGLAGVLVEETRGASFMSKIKILFLASDPFKTRPLALAREFKAIDAQIQAAEYRDSVELIAAWEVGPEELQPLLLRIKPHLVHFSGHGTEGTANGGSLSSLPTPDRELGPVKEGPAAQLVLTGDAGQPLHLSKDPLVALLRALKENIRVVVLNACHTKSQAEAIAQIVDCCIGMNAAIGDEAAIVFSMAFYRALSFGKDVETAFNLGKIELQGRGIRQDQIPERYCRREGVNPAKVILVGPRAAPTFGSVPSAPRPTVADRNRAAMIEKIRAIWITGFLHKSLFQEVRILLSLSEKPDAVERPLDPLVKRPDEGERPLPAGTQIIKVFDDSNKSLLILGAPGSGKTIQLLELTGDLLDRAD